MKNKILSKIYIQVFVLILISVSAFAQNEKKKPSLKDSLDKSFDLSDYIIEAGGFIPVPIIITEPALGGFGGGIVPVFLKRKPPYVDTIKGKVVHTPVAPDITGGMAIYTANNSWITGAFRSGTLVKSRIKYLAALGFANINMSYYRTVPALGEKEFKFNFRTVLTKLQATKRIGFSHWYAGFSYLFVKEDMKYVSDPVLPPDFAKPIEYASIISQLGAVIELDNRDNIFTPDNGAKVHFDVKASSNVIGSDYNFWRINYYTYGYKKISKKLIGGFRLDGQQALGDAPFFLLPYIDMRGIPANRYQGNADILTEAEARWDFYKRWSIMLYGGTGKAFNDWSDFGSSQWVYSVGSGFRYLLARKFKLRVGIDVARGPETWAYYIVFGSSWLK
jgi:hypothetical protein